MDSNRVDQIAENWGIQKQFLPIQYLGVPFGGKPLSLPFWDNMLEKTQKKLSSWKYSLISKGGKLTLIHSTLNSIPIYQLSVFKAPLAVCKSMEKLWRDFLWKNRIEDKITHLLRWEKVTK